MTKPFNGKAIHEFLSSLRWCSSPQEKAPPKDEPFGRQPKPVTIYIIGEAQDVTFWKNHLKRAASYKDDFVQDECYQSFKIYPRAVND